VAKQLGIAAIYQQPALFPELSVAENIAIGLEERSIFGRVDWRARKERAALLLARIGAAIDPNTEAGDLTMPEQQLVEIARALGAAAKVVIMDEPTASLSEEDTQNLFAVIRQLRNEGVGIIYISHRLEELPLIADRVTVLRDGQTIDTREMSEVDRQQLIQLMVGRELSAVFPRRTWCAAKLFWSCGDWVALPQEFTTSIFQCGRARLSGWPVWWWWPDRVGANDLWTYAGRSGRDPAARPTG
jgi:ABC-type sugar transport system, ATPase component